MQRVIKFRAWDKRIARMLKDASVVGGSIWWDGGSSFDGRGTEYEIMQFTGLLDQNGEQIYEGDILQDEDGYAVCSWCNNMSGWGYCLIEEDGSYNGAEGTMAEWSQACSVIGNIYENPELLEAPCNETK